MIPLFTADEQPTMAEFNERITQANADVQAAIQEAIEGGIAGGLKIVTGSYVGTGQHGSTHPNSITFPFIPLFWGVYMTYSTVSESYDQAGNFLEWNVSGKVTLKDDYDVGYANTVSYSGNTVSWYAGGDTEQLNDERTTYYYFAIGQGGAT